MKRRPGTLVCLAALQALAVFAVLALPDAALAQGARSRVALVRNESSDALLREANTRLRAELGDAGFEVVDVDAAPGDAHAAGEAGKADESFATVSMSRAGAGAAADVWISDRVTGKNVARRLQVGGVPNAASVLAIRALELLRASLLELAAPEPSEGSPSPAPAPDASHSVERSSPAPLALPWQPFQGTALGVGAEGLHGLRGVGIAFGPSLRVSHSLFEHWFGRLTLTGPMVGPEITEAAGSAAVRQEFASVDLGWASRARPIGAYAWIGLGAFDLHVTGSAIGPYRSKSQGVVSFLSTAGLGGVAHLGGRVALTAEVLVLALIPQPVVVIADHDAARAGAPSLGFSLGLLVGL